MATAYDRGAAYERRMMEILEHHQWFVVRSARSKGAADLVALDMSGAHRPPVLVQCKRTRAAVPPAEWNRLLDIARATGSTPVLAVAVFDTAGRAVRTTWTQIDRAKIPGHPVAEENLRKPWSPSVPPMEVQHAGMTPNWPPQLSRGLAAPGVLRAGTEGGLTPAELAGTDQGTRRCARDGCHHGDAVHGPFCFVAGCKCADWQNERRIRPV